MQIGDRVKLLSTGRMGTYIGTTAVFGKNVAVSWHDTGERSEVNAAQLQNVQQSPVNMVIGDRVRCIQQPDWGIGTVKVLLASAVNVLWNRYEQPVNMATAGLYVLPNQSENDCRSDARTTVGLIDSLLTVSRVLKTHDFSAPEVKEALKDLQEDPDLKYLLLPELVS